MNHPEQPREFDAVLGSQQITPQTALVLGGIEGVRRRATSPVAQSRQIALQEALKYGKAGLELIISGLYDESEQVQRVAYTLLQDRPESDVIRALKAYLPYRLFGEVQTVKVGKDATVDRMGSAIADQQGKNLRVWDLFTQKVLYTVPRTTRISEKYLLATPDLLIRVKNQHNGVLEIWQDGEFKHQLVGHEGRIEAIALSPDQTLLASGGSDAVIRLWTVDTGKLVGTFGRHLIFGSHTDQILGLQFSPTGHTLVSSSRDSTVKVWDLRTRDRPRTLKTYAFAFALSPDELTLATTNWYGHIQLWDLSTQKVRQVCEDHQPTVMTFSPYGRLLITGGRDRSIKFWNVYTGELFHQLSGHDAPITALLLRANGQSLLSLSEDKQLKVWGVP